MLQASGQINATTAKALTARLFTEPDMEPGAVCRREQLFLLTDPAALQELAQAVLRENPDMVKGYLAGKEALRKALMGKCMAAARGRADARLLEAALEAGLRQAGTASDQA